jgi:hypothetical protein
VRLVGPKGPGLLLFCASSIYGVLMFGGMGAFSLFIVDETPAGTIALKLYVLSSGLLLFGMSAAMGFLGIRAWFGQQRISLQEHQLSVRDVLALGNNSVVDAPLLLGRVSHALQSSYVPPHENAAVPKSMVPLLARSGLLNAYRPEYDLHLPVFLLSELEFREEPGHGTTMILRAATREFRVTWHLPPATSVWLCQRITSSLHDELQALGRQVTMEPVHS